MLNIENSFYESIDKNSEKQKDITEKEWDKINKDKTKILSKVSDSKKAEFESKYQELDEYFKQEREQVYETTINDLKLFKDSFKIETKSNQEIKNEFISKYSSEYKHLESDVVNFLNNAFNNSLDSELGDFNIDKFNNKDKKEGFSEFELEQYAQILDKAMSHMNILGSYSDFKEQYKGINKEPDFFSWKGDIALANKVDLQEYIFGEGEKYLTENLHNYSEEELHLMREEKFDITDGDKMKNFIALLGLELGDGIQDVLKFLGNMPAGLILLPRYINNRLELIDDKIDTKDEVEAQMENDMILKENPSLMLGELLGEKGIQMIKQLGEMFVSGKNGDIAMVLVTIAGLLAGGAGAVKFVAKGAKMTKTAKVAEKIQNKAAKVDDIVGGAGIGHMTGEFSSKTISNDIIAKNGNLNDGARIEEAEKVLGRGLTIEQKEALLAAHNYGSDKIGNYTTGEKVVKGKKLIEAGFSREEAQILLDQGIAGVSSRMLPSYEPGTIVNIKRSDGRIHEAKIGGVNNKGQLITFWEEGGVYMEKSFSPNQLDKINLINNIDFDINKASSIEELLAVIEKNGGIKGSNKFYTSNEIENLVYGYINNQNQAEFITNSAGLRNRVIELKREGKILKINENTTILNLDNKIEEANSIEELFNLIDKQGKIGDYDSIYLKKVINMYLNGEIELNKITRTSGLRDKVLLLKNSEFINKSVLKELWPNGLDAKTSQGYVGNCYFVAGLNSVKNHPNGGKLLEEMITIKSSGVFEVNFLGYNEPVIITMKDLDEMILRDKSGNIKYDSNGNILYTKIDTDNIGDIIIERAHARVVNKIKKGKEGQTMYLGKNKNKLLHEGGNEYKVLNLFYGDKIDAKEFYIHPFKDISKMLDKDSFMTIGSKQKTGMTDKNKYLGTDYYGNDVNIHYGHAYTIYDFDKNEGWVSIVNPHNSSEQIKYNIKDIHKNFGDLTIGKFKN